MFTIDIVLGILKKVFASVFSFIWEYKGWILLGIIVGALYVRGNNYKEDYQSEVVEHNKSVLQHKQDLENIRIANETALRIAKEKAFEDYKVLVEKTSELQEKYDEREKDINTTVNKLNVGNNSLQQAISNYTKRNTNTYSGKATDSSYAESLQLSGELLGECVERKQYYATEASKLSNSVNTLQEWGQAVIEQSNKVNGVVSKKGVEDEIE